MLRIAQLPQVRVRVELMVSNGDGLLEDQSFTAVFQIQGLDDDESDAAFSTRAGQDAFIQKALVGVEDITDNAGQPLAFGPELQSALVRRVDTRGALIRAYLRSSSELSRGNFNGQPAHGQREDMPSTPRKTPN